MIRSNRLKLLLIFFANLLNRRYYSVRIDPIFACNLRCRMCYFSKSRKSQPKRFTHDELTILSKNLFGNALQVVVGCGAEPTLHTDFAYIVKLAKQQGVPHVGMVTNGQLLKPSDLTTLSDAGLDELTLSVHGVQKQTYEHFMSGASWDKLMVLLNEIKSLKRARQISYAIRINFTANPSNVNELYHFFDVFGLYPISILQIRPIMEIGGEYNELFAEEALHSYNKVVASLKQKSREMGITLLANLQNPGYKKTQSNQVITETYKYVSPYIVVSSDFHWQEENYRSYLNRSGWYISILKKIFLPQRNISLNELAERYGGQYDVF